jgi:hypothetical protein
MTRNDWDRHSHIHKANTCKLAALEEVEMLETGVSHEREGPHLLLETEAEGDAVLDSAHLKEDTSGTNRWDERMEWLVVEK